MMEVITGVSSLDSARPKTPPTDRVRPSFANSRTNCRSARKDEQRVTASSPTPTTLHQIYDITLKWRRGLGVTASASELVVKPNDRYIYL